MWIIYIILIHCTRIYIIIYIYCLYIYYVIIQTHIYICIYLYKYIVIYIIIPCCATIISLHEMIREIDKDVFVVRKEGRKLFYWK